MEITDPGDPSQHVLAGDILSPDTTRAVADAIVALFGAQLPETFLDGRGAAQRQHDDQIPGLRPVERLLQ